VYTAQGTFRLSGAAWAELLNNTARKATLLASIQTDIAALLGISPTYVVILNLSIGSLIIDFAVLQGSGKSVTDLVAAASSAQNNTSWLTSTKSVYALVSNETITVLSVTAVAVSGGTTAVVPPPSPTNASTTTTSSGVATPAPSGISSPSSASSVSLFAAVAVAFGAIALAL
jgi:hypothetical protein